MRGFNLKINRTFAEIFMRTAFTFFIVSAIFCITNAQQDLDSVFISGSRIENTIENSGRAVSVILASEFQEWPVNTVEELLLYISGVNINNRGAYGVQADMGIRGSTFSQILVLIDNQRLNDPLTGHFNNYIPIPLSEIDRIEVIKGSVASAYGADAVGGVIHIKTKSYEMAQNPELDKTSSSGNIARGDYNLLNIDAALQQKIGKWGFSLGTKAMISDGPTFENPNFKANNFSDSLYSNYFDIRNFTSGISYTSDKWRMHYRIAIDQRKFSAKYFYTVSLFDESEEVVSNLWNQLNVKRLWKNGVTELGVSLRNGRDSFTFNPNVAANVHTTERLNATLMHTFNFSKFRLNVGSQADYQTIISTDRGDHQLFNLGGFATSHFTWENIHFNMGLRAEMYQQSNLYLIPQLSLSKPFNKGHIQTSMGRAVRQADFTERFVGYRLNQPSAGRNIGNPDLLLEDAWNYDVGGRYKWSKNLITSAAIFHRISNNLIDYQMVNSTFINNHPNLQMNTNYLYAANIGETKTSGFEFEGAYKKQLKKDKQLWFRLAYTGMITSSSDSVVSKYVSNHPLNQIAISMDIKRSYSNLHIGYHHFIRNSEDLESIDALIPYSYGLLNARISSRIPDIDVEFYLDFRNVLNTQYEEILGARMPGSWFAFGVKWNL